MAQPFDHPVLTVRDLDAAGATFARLGFQVGARNRHPWGTENRIVQLDGVFLELITVGAGATIAPHGPRHFSFGACVRDALAMREGIAMLALRTRDAKADAKRFAANGIGDFEPFSFERQGRRADGSQTRVGFTLAFARDELAPDAAFFVSQHHFPENFWDARLQQHPNGARAITSVAMVAENPTDHHIFLSAFTGERELRASSLGISVEIQGGRIDVLTPQAAQARYGIEASDQPLFIGYSVSLPDLFSQKRRLAGAGIAFETIGGRLVVPPAQAFGAAIAFETAAGSA